MPRIAIALVFVALCCGGWEMSTSPPDDFEIGNGTWGTDADMALAADMPGTMADPISADACVLFEDTTPGSDPYLQLVDDKLVEVEAGMPYRIVGVVQADSIVAGNWVRVAGLWYTAAGAYISASYAHNAVLPAVDTWYEMALIVDAPATARYIRPRFAKENTAFHAAFDTLGIQAVPRGFRAYDSVGGLIATATTTKVVMNAESYDYGSVNNQVTDQFEAPAAGTWDFTASVGLASVGDGTVVEVGIFVNGAAYSLGERTAQGANQDVRVQASALGVYVSRGDYVDVRVWQNSGGNLSLNTGATETWFSGAERR